MLVITRKPHEGILVLTPNGEQVKIFITRVRGNQVRVGVGTPNQDWRIHRIGLDRKLEEPDRDPSVQFDRTLGLDPYGNR